MRASFGTGCCSLHRNGRRSTIMTVVGLVIIGGVVVGLIVVVVVYGGNTSFGDSISSTENSPLRELREIVS